MDISQTHAFHSSATVLPLFQTVCKDVIVHFVRIRGYRRDVTCIIRDNTLNQFQDLSFVFSGFNMAMYGNVSHFVYVICSPVLSTAFVVLNILTIIIFVRKFRIASLSLVILTNICLCDVAVCLLSNNFYVINLVHPSYAWATGSYACKLFKTLTMMCNLCQIFSFVILCWDRMRRLVWATDRQWKKKQGIISLIFIWCLSFGLTGGRFVLFDEHVISKSINGTNTTKIVNFACKPIGINTMAYTIMTILQFVAGYLIPSIIILTTIGLCEYNLRITKTIGNSHTMKMYRQLSNVFNMTALLFLIIWTPFFIMSVIDLKTNLLGDKTLTHLNFSFRCTLLVAGSGKPLVYMIALRKFRAAMCSNICTRPIDAVREDTSSYTDTRGGNKKGPSTISTIQSSVDQHQEKKVDCPKEFADIAKCDIEIHDEK